MTVTREGRVTICSQCHVPRSQCDPTIRHVQSFRCGDGLWDAMTALGVPIRTDRNWEMEQALKEWVALPDDRDTFHTIAIAHEGIHRNLRTVRCSDELWGQVAAKARRLGMKYASGGARAALRRKAVLGGGAEVADAEPAGAERTAEPAGEVESLRADLDSFRVEVRDELGNLRSDLLGELKKLTAAHAEPPAAERKVPRARKAPSPVAANGSAAPVRFEDGTGEQAAW